jgi:hypothetical protein
MALPGYEDHALCEFFAGSELNGDPSNWWAPNEQALAGMCRAAGFRRVDVLIGSKSGTLAEALKRRAARQLRKWGLLGRAVEKNPLIRYRAVAHAWK